MQIQINPGSGITLSEALEQHIHDKLETLEKRFGDRLTRVEVHLEDINGPKGGPDKHCKLEARPSGLEPAIAESTTEDAYEGISLSTDRLKKVLETQLGKRGERG